MLIIIFRYHLQVAKIQGPVENLVTDDWVLPFGNSSIIVTMALLESFMAKPALPIDTLEKDLF